MSSVQERVAKMPKVAAFEQMPYKQFGRLDIYMKKMGRILLARFSGETHVLGLGS